MQGREGFSLDGEVTAQNPVQLVLLPGMPVPSSSVRQAQLHCPWEAVLTSTEPEQTNHTMLCDHPTLQQGLLGGWQPHGSWNTGQCLEPTV